MVKVFKKQFSIIEIDMYGTKTFYNKWRLHRIGMPAVIGIRGYKAWLFYGKYHKINGYCNDRNFSIYEKIINVNIGRVII